MTQALDSRPNAADPPSHEQARRAGRLLPPGAAVIARTGTPGEVAGLAELITTRRRAGHSC
jgi:hypothetical protein